jgi:hypothetical protein
MSDQSQDWYWQKRWTSFRSGTTRIALEFENKTATALLYEEGVPKTVGALLARLPLSVPVVHVAWSGDMVMSTQSYDIGSPEMENQVRLVRPGDLSWDPKFGEFAFTYGTAECKLPSGPNTVVVFGAIVEGLEAFAEYAHRRRFEGVGEVKMSIA